MSTIFRTLLVASSLMIWAAPGAHSTEYQCRKQDSTLRIAIEVKKAGHTLPCEVIAEDDRGELAVLYSARYDREYCPSRIEKTRGELEQEGWSCQKTSDENIVSDESGDVDDLARQSQPEAVAAEAEAEIVEVAGSEILGATEQRCRLDDQFRHISIRIEDPASGKPCELIYWDDGDQTRPGEVLWRAEHDAAFCPNRLNIIVQKWISEGWQCGADDVQTAAIERPVEDEPEAVADQAIAAPSEETADGTEAETQGIDSELEAIIAADAERIGEWMEVEPDIEVAARGDLNEDGTDDAVVFLAYQSDQAAYRQYMMSYLVDGEGYQLASVKLLTGVGPPPAQARVEQIEEGVIWLSMPDENGSNSGQTGYRLRDQQLVEVTSDTALDAGGN